MHLLMVYEFLLFKSVPRICLLLVKRLRTTVTWMQISFSVWRNLVILVSSVFTFLQLVNNEWLCNARQTSQASPLLGWRGLRWRRRNKKKKNAPDQLKNKGCPCIQNYNYNSCCFGELLNILYMLVTFNKIKPIANGKKMLLC